MADIPQVPGVPALLTGFAPNLEALLTQDQLTGYGIGSTPMWGLYSGGSPIITADTVLAFNYRREWAIADYPVERGAFESYDKVSRPFEAAFDFVTGGSVDAREAMLASISTIAGDLKLYDVVTPEVIYPSVNVQRYDYRRSDGKVGLLMVRLYVLEIRVTAGTTPGQNAQSASGSATTSTGPVQASGSMPPTTESVDRFTQDTGPVPYFAPSAKFGAPDSASTTNYNLLPVQ